MNAPRLNAGKTVCVLTLLLAIVFQVALVADSSASAAFGRMVFTEHAVGGLSTSAAGPAGATAPAQGLDTPAVFAGQLDVFAELGGSRLQLLSGKTVRSENRSADRHSDSVAPSQRALHSALLWIRVTYHLSFAGNSRRNRCGTGLRDP